MTVDEETRARTYQYKHGDRPLEGYTIQRAAGRGGFGEVYYALSDSGREVALKLVLTYEKIELRGISQCMNIKSPQLVTIFDVKHGIDGRPWVIMEFVSGPSLRELLDAAPSGLGTAKSAFFLREIAKGLTYLHDCGIVHRDLKPGNIFYENGCVKIGDYGLSKAMNMSQHSGQTVAVGTLHYMAPEIGDGRYDRTIDIYALGALLFEMITGQVPFYGSSVAEVLMKHLRSDVCLDGIEEPFLSVIRNAMAKNPADRYQNVQEMVEAVFGSEDVRNSMSQFSPSSLSQIAGRAARGVGAGNFAFDQPDGDPMPPAWDRATARARAKLQRAQKRLERARRRVAHQMGGDWNPKPAPSGPVQADQLTRGGRIFLVILAIGFSAFIGIISSSGRQGPEDGCFVIAAIFGCLIGLFLARKIIGSSLAAESRWIQRLALGLPAALGAGIASFPIWIDRRVHHDNPLAIIQACMGAMVLLDWERRLSPHRRERLCLSHQITAGLCALILGDVLDCDNPPLVVITVVGASIAAGLLSRWGPRFQSPQGAVSPQENAGVADPFAMAFRPTRPPVPPIPLYPVAAAIDFNGPSTASSKPARKKSGSLGLFHIFVAAVLWVFCLRAAHIANKPASVLLLFAAIGATSHVLMKNRAGIFSAAGRSSDGDAVSPRASMVGVAASVARGVVGMVASILLSTSVALALLVSLNVPGFLDHGILDARMPYEMERIVGSPQWPRLLSEGATAVCTVLSIASVVLFFIARRPAGGGHMIRALLGVAVLVGGSAAMGHAMPDLGEVTRAATPADTVDQYFQRVQFKEVVQASSGFLVGAVLLGWPSRRNPRPVKIPAMPSVVPLPATEEPKG